MANFKDQLRIVNPKEIAARIQAKTEKILELAATCAKSASFPDEEKKGIVAPPLKTTMERCIKVLTCNQVDKTLVAFSKGVYEWKPPGQEKLVLDGKICYFPAVNAKPEEG